MIAITTTSSTTVNPRRVVIIMSLPKKPRAEARGSPRKRRSPHGIAAGLHYSAKRRAGRGVDGDELDQPVLDRLSGERHASGQREPPELRAAAAAGHGGLPADWGELMQVHDDRAIFQGRIDELPVIDIRSL